MNILIHIERKKKITFLASLSEKVTCVRCDKLQLGFNVRGPRSSWDQISFVWAGILSADFRAVADINEGPVTLNLKEMCTSSDDDAEIY